MRTLGIVLILAGIVMLCTNGFNFQTEKTVADIGPLKINKKENKHVGWPTYSGGIIAVVGVVLVIAGGKGKRR